MQQAANPSEPPPPAVARRRWLRPLLASLGYAAIVGLAWRAIDHERFADGIARLRATDLLIVLAISLLHIAGRALRFHRLMLRNHPTDYRWTDGFSIFLIGLSTSAVTPARAGDFVKAQLVRKHSVSFTAGFGLVLIERMLDLLVLTMSIVLAGVALSSGTSAPWSRAAFMLLGALIAGIAAITSQRIRKPIVAFVTRAIRRVSKGRGGEGLADKLENVFGTWDAIFTSPLAFLRYLVASAIVWGIEFTKLWCVLWLLGTHASLPVIYFVYPVSILAGVLTILPFSEGVVGVTGVALLAALGGVDAATATVAVVLDRAASSLPPIAIAGVTALLRPSARRDEAEESLRA
jgi:uncharacterized protein (TIRG00374 family)